MIAYVAEAISLLVAVTAVAVIRVRDLFTLVVLLSVYSGLLAVLFAVLGAVDVAFTEAVVGTSVSTMFLVALMWWIDPHDLRRYGLGRRLLAWGVALAVGGVLLVGVNALPAFGDPLAPATVHIAPAYIAGSVPDAATPNVVTAVLADYRSFDTLIETAVVLTAALACLLILRRYDDPAV